MTTFDNYQPPSEPERPSHADENLGGGSDPRTDGTLSCPICHGTSFIQEESRQEGRWGFTSHVMTLFVCQQCRFVLHFYDTHSPLDDLAAEQLTRRPCGPFDKLKELDVPCDKLKELDGPFDKLKELDVPFDKLKERDGLSTSSRNAADR